MREALTGTLLARAIRLYIEKAYEDALVPPTRAQFADLDPKIELEQVLALSGVQKNTDGATDRVASYSFRIGNAWYQHMKIQVAFLEADSVVFSVDTHDRFDVPAHSPEIAEVRALQRRNQQLAREVEQSWEKHGIPTQAGILRQYLAKPHSLNRSLSDAENRSV